MWASRKAATGTYANAEWSDLLAFLREPQPAESKDDLEGWSPVKFRDDRRLKSCAESVSCAVLDDDQSGLPLERLLEVWAGVEGAVHTSFSHEPSSPKYRIVLRCNRDMTPAEHERVMSYLLAYAASQGEALDAGTKDPSRLWYVPAQRSGAPFEFRELTGAPLPVDEILNAGTPDGSHRVRESGLAAASAATPVAEPAQPIASAKGSTRRAAMAAALGAAWPDRGRHQAQLALAGALRAEGWSSEDTLEFLCDVCRAAGDEDRHKRAATVEHTWGLAPDAPMTGWTRLKSHVDAVVVDAARGALGREATWTEATMRRLAEAAGHKAVTLITNEGVPQHAEQTNTVNAGRFTFEVSGLDAELPPISYLVDSLVGRGEVIMLVAHGNSLKTWLALSVGLSVASGRPWLGKYLVQRGRVAVLDFESGKYELVRRLKLIGAKDADVGSNLLRCSYSEANLTDPEAWIDLASLGLSLIIIDSFAAADPFSDENDKRSALLLKNAGAFAEATGCTVIVIHHSRKGSGGDKRESVRGSTAIFAACDRIFEFSDLEEVGDVVKVTMGPIKPGAGKRPSPVRVSLTDQGLSAVPIEVATEDEESPEDRIRKDILQALTNRPAGVNKTTLLESIKGKKDLKYEVMASLLLSDILVEIYESHQKIVLLNPTAGSTPVPEH